MTDLDDDEIPNDAPLTAEERAELWLHLEAYAAAFLRRALNEDLSSLSPGELELALKLIREEIQRRERSPN